jgi:hypothetical protein
MNLVYELILLYSNRRHVSATHVAIFMVKRTIKQKKLIFRNQSTFTLTHTNFKYKSISR